MIHSLVNYRPNLLARTHRKFKRVVLIFGYVSLLYLTFYTVIIILNSESQDKGGEALQQNEWKKKGWTDYQFVEAETLRTGPGDTVQKVLNSESQDKGGEALQQNERKKKDWTDYQFVEAEKLRTGPGEHGKPFKLKNETEIALSQKIIEKYSHNGLVSDKISLDRAIPDRRHPNCLNRTYYDDLPPVSVIITFRNEYLSPLLRTLNSIINRTPKELLTEIILVDDCSTEDYLKTELDEYIQNYHPDVIRILRLTEQHGLAKARMEGIKVAVAEIVVIFDAHIEVGTNWLPPLIEPIVDDYQTITEPVWYFINSETYGIENTTRDGALGVYSWSLTSTWIARNIENDPSANYENPTLLGALIVVNKTFFWELEGFDRGLEVWGNEQYDLSFKVWRCSKGRILSIPCSQVGHNFKSLGNHPFYKFSSENPYLIRNTNRVIEIWFDEPYKSFYQKIYKSNWQDKGFGENIEAMYEYRKRKNCKSYQWYLDNVYPQMNQMYPIDWDEKPAYGQIKSMKFEGKCIDTLQRKENIGLYVCHEVEINIPGSQNFLYTLNHEIRSDWYWQCWDAFLIANYTKVSLNKASCHSQGGNQKFTFDLNKRTIKRTNHNECLTAKMENGTSNLYLEFEPCTGSLEQQWKWTNENKTLLDKIDT